MAAAVCLLLGAAAAEASCTVSTTSVNFGSYNVFASAPTDSTGNVTLRCNSSARNVQIELDGGDSPSVFFRFMNKGFEFLFYNLYKNAARTTLWGENGLSYDVGDPPNNRDVTLTIYGRIPAGQDVSAGTYTDTVTVTVQF